MKYGQSYHLEDFPGVCMETLVGGAYKGQNSQATILAHKALLLVSKNCHSQNPRRLFGPWAGGDYRLILVLKTVTLTEPHPSSPRNQREYG